MVIDCIRRGSAIVLSFGLDQGFVALLASVITFF